MSNLQDTIVGTDDVPYLVRLGFIDFILSLLRTFKEDEEARYNVLSSIGFETWSYFTSSFLHNSHGNIYHCRYLELLIFVLDYEHEDSFRILHEKCKILDLFLSVYEKDDEGSVCTLRTDAKGHILQFFQSLSESPLSKTFLKSHEKWDMFLKSRLETEIRLNSVDGGEEEEEVVSGEGSVIENDVDEEEDVGGGLD